MKKILFTLAICAIYLSDLLTGNALAVGTNPYSNMVSGNLEKISNYYGQQPITIRYKYPTANAKKLKEMQSHGTMGQADPSLELTDVQIKPTEKNIQEIKINNNNFVVSIDAKSTINTQKHFGKEIRKATQEELNAKKLEIQKLEAKLKQEKLEQELLQAKLEQEQLLARQEEIRLEQERLLAKQEQAKLEQKKLQAQRQEETRLEQEKLQAKQEKARLEQERLQAQKLAQEKLAKEKIAQKLAQEKLEQEKLAKAEQAKQKQLAEKERIRNMEAKKIEAAMQKAQKLEKQRREAERLEIERLERQNLQAQKLEQERQEIERLENQGINPENIQIATAEEFVIEQTSQDFAIISNLQNHQEIAKIEEITPKPQNNDPNRIIEYSEDWSTAWKSKPSTNNKPEDAKLIKNAQDKILTVAERTKSNSKLSWDILNY